MQLLPRRHCSQYEKQVWHPDLHSLKCVGAPQVKMHWVHENYWQPGPQGNDIQKTNVPNLRMRFRYDNHQEEVRLQSRPDGDKAEAFRDPLLCLVFARQQSQS